MPGDEPGGRGLVGIAAALGLEVGDFLGAPAAEDRRDLVGRLRLWERITDRQARARLIGLARVEALRRRSGGKA